MCITKWKGWNRHIFNKNNEILIENQVKKEKLQDLINTNLSKE
jgi:hypothetical protein